MGSKFDKWWKRPFGFERAHGINAFYGHLVPLSQLFLSQEYFSHSASFLFCIQDLQIKTLRERNIGKRGDSGSPLGDYLKGREISNIGQ